MEHTIDAKGKTPGRVAAAAATLLLCKNIGAPKNKTAPVKVKILNAAQALIDEKKLKQKMKARYSGYPGGLRKESWESIGVRKGYPEIVRVAIAGMLPNNKLKKLRMKNLEIVA